MTIATKAEELNLTHDALIRKVQRATGERPGKHSELKPEWLAIIDGKQAKANRKTDNQLPAIQSATLLEPVAKLKQGSAPKTKTASGRVESVICIASVSVSVILFNYGTWKLAGIAGVFVGLMFGLYLAFSVRVCTDKMKGDTSEAALKSVLFCEVCAVMLHTYTIYGGLTFDASEFIKASVAGFIAAMVAFFSYQSVVGIRNYYAET